MSANEIDMQHILHLKGLADELSTLLQEKAKTMNGAVRLWEEDPEARRESDVRMNRLCSEIGKFEGKL